MQPKVSIIVPCYGVERYLDRCMESIVNQTLKDIEIILVDDKSPDRVPEMCDEWAKKDERIRVIHKEKNEGLGFARNTGLDVAIGEYVAFVDSDDYVDVKMYETLYAQAKENDCDVLFCGFWKEGKCSVHEIRECSDYKEYSGNEIRSLIPDFIANKPYEKSEYVYEMSVWHSIYKCSVIKDNNLKFVSERVYSSEDTPFQIDFFMHACKVAFIPVPFYRYCYNGDSLTKKVTLEKFDKIKALYRLLYEKSKDLDPDGLRSKRLFIGYMRSYIRTLSKSRCTFAEKKRICEIVLHDSIWDEIRRIYKTYYFNVPQRVFSFLMYHKLVYGTLAYAWIVDSVKK